MEAKVTNSAREFIGTKVTRVSGAFENAKHLYAVHYASWCVQNGVEQQNITDFGLAIADAGFSKVRKTKRRTWHYVDLSSVEPCSLCFRTSRVEQPSFSEGPKVEQVPLSGTVEQPLPTETRAVEQAPSVAKVEQPSASAEVRIYSDSDIEEILKPQGPFELNTPGAKWTRIGGICGIDSITLWLMPEAEAEAVCTEVLKSFTIAVETPVSPELHQAKVDEVFEEIMEANDFQGQEEFPQVEGRTTPPEAGRTTPPEDDFTVDPFGELQPIRRSSVAVRTRPTRRAPVAAQVPMTPMAAYVREFGAKHGYVDGFYVGRGSRRAI